MKTDSKVYVEPGSEGPGEDEDKTGHAGLAEFQPR